MTGARNGANRPRDIMLEVEHLRAYYVLRYFGAEREVRAVDDISLRVHKNEIYGLAGESSSGKTTLIKTIAAAIRPPLKVISGSIRYSFLDRDIYRLDRSALSAIRWRHLSYIPQGSMNVLNPVRRVRESFIDFALPHMGVPRQRFFDTVIAHLKRLQLAPPRARCLSPRTFWRHAPARDYRACHRLPAGFYHRRRTDDRS